MKRYPEYFIGGPLDGQDKSVLFPDVQDWETIRRIEETGYEIELAESYVPVASVTWTWSYYCHRIQLGGITLKYWYDTRMVSRQIVALRFWELILAPHEIKVSLIKEGAKT